ncbi:type II toxin-antitoxin system ParD family antitoxin [Pseudomonas syringae]|uniref:ribbon-helix-helix domain-containing protein n=1 Tax=Pseudomonas syringae TaxID=317 RepID=UPI0031FE4D60|nr:type II toxin-antitoxin system ParD family antitoxin [Pseudomonas syringae]
MDAMRFARSPSAAQQCDDVGIIINKRTCGSIMETVRKIIALVGQQHRCVKEPVDLGDRTHDSGCNRDFIRHEQARRIGIEAIRLALIEGESSGEPRAFNVDHFKQRVLKAKG